MSSDGIRRRPTLPGRFQPSTISVLRLNFCVRDGNRWIPQAIVTGNWAGPKAFCCRASSRRRIGQRTASRLTWVALASPPFVPFRISASRPSLRFARSFGFAPSKPHRFGSLWLTDHVSLRFPSTLLLPLSLFKIKPSTD